MPRVILYLKCSEIAGPNFQLGKKKDLESHIFFFAVDKRKVTFNSVKIRNNST